MNDQTVNPADNARPDTLESEMIAEQWRLEEAMTERGYEAYTRTVNNARVAGAEHQTAYGMTLMKHRVEAVSAGIKEFMEVANSGKAGRGRRLAHRSGTRPATRSPGRCQPFGIATAPSCRGEPSPIQCGPLGSLGASGHMHT